MALNQPELAALALPRHSPRRGPASSSTTKPSGQPATGSSRAGHLIEVEDVEGGYTLSEEFAKAMLINTAQKTEQAKDN